MPLIQLVFVISSPIFGDCTLANVERKTHEPIYMRVFSAFFTTYQLGNLWVIGNYTVSTTPPSMFKNFLNIFSIAK